MPQYDINKVDTSSFNPEQLSAFNTAKSLIPAPVTKPVTLLSSDTGANIVNENKTKLGNLEQSIVIPQGATLSGLATKYGTNVQDIMKQNPNITDPDVIQAGASLRLPLSVAGSPATSKMASEINTAAQNGGMTPTERAGLQSLQSTADEVTTSAAKARAALESKDYASMDYWTNKATADRQQYEQQLADYYSQTKELRQRLTENLSPSEKEQKLGQQVVDIRSQAEAFNLQTEEDKFKEYEGQTMGFAGKRASEIDLRASFKRQEFALKEKNLLLSLGLEQDARKMEQTSIENQLGYLASDYELQQKVQDKISASEEAVFQRADTLQKDAKDTLVKLLDGMQGVDPSTMPAETKKQLEDIAYRAGLPFDLVEQALKTQHDKQVFDNSLKLAQERRLSGGTGGAAEQLYSGLSAATATAVRSKVGKFSTEPLVQNFATIQDGYNFASSLADETKNPADDQALIYSLAKALDPGSVVREGEYATAQKYAQSWIASYGKGVEQALYGTGFLSKTARSNIKKTIEQKYLASKKSYDQLVNSYKTGINSLTGRNDSDKFLTDYVIPTQTEKYDPGTTFVNNGILYSVEDDGETITPIANYAG